MKKFIPIIIVVLSFATTAYGNQLSLGKYMLSAPALYAAQLSNEIKEVDSELYDLIKEFIR